MNMNENEHNAPLVSVIVPLYNGEEFVERTVDSVLNQTYQNLELIVVDDGSTDSGLETVQSFAEKHPDKVRVFSHPAGKNRGVSATRNLGIKKSNGELIAFLDADDIWSSAKLERQVSFMRENPDIALSYSQAGILREGINDRFIPEEDILGTDLPPERRIVLYHIILVLINYIFSTVIVRRKELLETGGFVEGLPFQSEDRIMVAMVAARHKIGFLKENLCSYRAHAGSYTAQVVNDRLPPAIFYDVQVRVMRWMFKEKINTSWAKEIGCVILPVSFVRAIFCSLKPRVMTIVLLDFIQSIALCPSIPFRMFAVFIKFFFKPGAFKRLFDLLGRTALFRRFKKTNRESA
ncbi:glycosyltransferase family 2 protein [PVC group bacterium]|nr:glycosyltransferase family 2 protein [PVC group bacterium]